VQQSVGLSALEAAALSSSKPTTHLIPDKLGGMLCVSDSSISGLEHKTTFLMPAQNWFTSAYLWL